jgi:hypothetical protein
MREFPLAKGSNAMIEAHIPSKSSDYRRKSSTCLALVACAKSASDREQLLSMSRLWLTRAASEEWSEGLPSLLQIQSSALSRWTSIV